MTAQAHFSRQGDGGMPFDIRTPHARDLEALLAIENAAFPGDRLSRRSLRRLMEAKSAIICATEEDGRIIGYALALTRRTSTIARLYSIAVDPAESGRGVAAALLLELERRVLDRGLRAVRLEVREDNEGAIRLYQRAGYHPFGRYENYYQDGMSALRYEKALRAFNTESGPR